MGMRRKETPWKGTGESRRKGGSVQTRGEDVERMGKR